MNFAKEINTRTCPQVNVDIIGPFGHGTIRACFMSRYGPEIGIIMGPFLHFQSR